MIRTIIIYFKVNALKINNYYNCYKKCKYYFYFDNQDNKYYCTAESKCPNKYIKLIIDNNQCINDCKKDNECRYEFRHTCYKECPPIISEISKIKKYYCEAICNKDYPFEMVNTQECVSNCNINERKNKLCIINYVSEEKEASTAQDIAINNIKAFLKGTPINVV